MIAGDFIHVGDTVRSVLERQAELHGEKVHLIDPMTGQTLTYAETLQRVSAIADAIAAQGVKPAQPVAYAFSNSLESALTILAILYGGYLAVAINLVAGGESIKYVLQHSEAKLVVADHDGAIIIGESVGDAQSPPIIDINDLLSIEASPSGVPLPHATARGLLMYTSGTTGRPKGVVHTHHSLLMGGVNTAMAHQLTGDDCGLCVLPFYHINAFCVSLMGGLVSAGRLVVAPKFSVSLFWDTIRDNHCSWFSVVPTQIAYLLHDADTSGGNAEALGVRFGRSASAPLSPDIHKVFEQTFGIPIIETMGLTETAAPILSNPLPPEVRKIGSSGIAFGNEVIIGDDRQKECPRGEEGEILVRGENVMVEYLKNPEATAETLTPSGWLRTGDLGRMDQDGYVFVTGRLKELIIKGGENIAPREIDDALYSHPDVLEAAAFAVPCSNYGQRIEAGVKVKDNARIDAESLREYCRDKLGDFKLPDRIYLLPELPKGPSGKIQRIKLAEIAEKMDDV